MRTHREPVLVLHGIKIRDREKFHGIVGRLEAALGKRRRLVPVYWGDLGGSDRHLELALPVEHRPETAGGTFWERTLARGVVGETPRAFFTRRVLPIVGDILAYQGAHGRRRIQRRVREALPEGWGTEERPISVIAHSLGGVIVFDMAVCEEPPLWIRHLFTLGGQASFFHLQDPRAGIAEAAPGRPVVVPRTIGRWTNFRDRHDWLAFEMGRVFCLHDGAPVAEVEVKSGITALDGFFRSHVAYWENETVLAEIRRGLARRGRPR